MFRSNTTSVNSTPRPFGPLGAASLALLCFALTQTPSQCAEEKSKPSSSKQTAVSTSKSTTGAKTSTKPVVKAKSVVAPKKNTGNQDASTKRYSDLNKGIDKSNKNVAAGAQPPGKEAGFDGKKRKRTSTLMVPPPPPTIPTYLDVPQSGFEAGFSVQLLSIDDLKFQKTNLEKKLEAAKADEEEQKKATDEKQERAKRFVELFEEGVVSRRELETSHAESDKAKRDLEQAHLKVAELDHLLGRVKERIQTLDSMKKPAKAVAKNGSRKKSLAVEKLPK